MKRAIIVHGWASHPKDGWFPWLKNELEKLGYEVLVPKMPAPLIPIMKKWVGHLSKIVGPVDQDTIFIGHSIGCQAIIRYLETLDTPIRGAIFVAGFFKLEGLESVAEEKIAEAWTKTPIDLEKVKRIMNKSVAIFSDNDRFVPLEINRKAFEEKLSSEIIVDHGMKHYSGNQGIRDVPSVLVALKKLPA
ncbi:alpha/beta hydrolase [Candidatus Uhrbacteria bacterium]|nr:alpha/beta hydrolase [Candidatus Uhrbacteria bacterium]